MPNFCPNCGTTITDKVKFCPNCGADINSLLERAADIPEPDQGTGKEPDPTGAGHKNGNQKSKQMLKDVYISVICSFFIPGLGQIYTGDSIKGVGIGLLFLLFLIFSLPLAFIIWLIGLIDAYYDTDQINNGKKPFRPADSGDMIIYGIIGSLCILTALFNPGFFPAISSSTTNSFSSQLGSGSLMPGFTETSEQRNIRIVKEIAAEYHKTHTYYGNDIFVCGDMASDVWNMLKTQGINAKIQIGRIDRQINDIFDANHAWVVAEVAPDTWLAVETTAGTVIYNNENPLYYYGKSFYTPKQFKDYSTLLKQYNDAVSKYEAARTDYNNMVNEYNAAGLFTRIGLKDDLDAKQLVLNERTRDLNEVTQQLNALLASS